MRNSCRDPAALDIEFPDYERQVAFECNLVSPHISVYKRPYDNDFSLTTGHFNFSASTSVLHPHSLTLRPEDMQCFRLAMQVLDLAPFTKFCNPQNFLAYEPKGEGLQSTLEDSRIIRKTRDDGARAGQQAKIDQ